MKPLFTLSIGVLFILATAQTAFTPSPSQIRIKRSANLKTGKYIEYSYNRDGRIASHWSSVNPQLRTSYSYSKNLIIKIPPTVNDYEPTIDTMYLDNAGLVTEIRSTVGKSAGYVTKIEYKNGYWTKATHFHEGALKFMDEHVVVNGNVVKLIQKSPDKSIDNDKYFSTFYTDKPNTINDEAIGKTFMGKDSKNPEKETFYISDKGDTILKTTSNYRYDDKQRIILRVTYNAKGELNDSTAYTYY